MIKEITEKQKLKEYEKIKYKFFVLGGHKENNRIYNSYTDHIYEYVYIYLRNNNYNNYNGNINMYNLEKVIIKEI